MFVDIPLVLLSGHVQESAGSSGKACEPYLSRITPSAVADGLAEAQFGQGKVRDEPIYE